MSIPGDTTPNHSNETFKEPLYEGKPLSEWLDLPGRERSTIGQEDSAPALAAQSCMIPAQGAELNEEQRAGVLAAVNQRLAAYCESREAMIQLVKTADAFSMPSLPDIGQPARSSIRVVPVSNKSESSLVSVLPDVISGLEGTASVPVGLGSSELRWPEMSVDPHSQMNSMQIRRTWGHREPTAQDWLESVTGQHPVMQQHFAESAAKTNDASGGIQSASPEHTSEEVSSPP